MEVLQKFIIEVFDTLKEMSPYLLFGFFVAGLLSVYIKPETVERHLGGGGFLQVVKASLFGVPLPLCSCGVIPVSVSLRKHGASKGAMTSFLISTPQTGIDSIFVTLSLLGPVYAIFRPVIAFISGIIGGSAINIFDKDGENEVSTKHVCGPDTCGIESGPRRFSQIFRYAFRTLPSDINKALVIGILIAAVIGALVPDDFLSGILGGGIIAMLVMIALGIPVYVCATASVPIAAALVAKGVSPGAALVFLMTGPATNAATILTVGKILGRRSAGIYLATVALSAIGAGLLLDFVYRSPFIGSPGAMPFMLPGWIGVASAVALSVIIAVSFLPGRRVAELTAPVGTEKAVIRIKGMTCEHCVFNVKRALLEIPGVKEAVVDLKRGEAVITGDHIDQTRIAESVRSVGYSVTEQKIYPLSGGDEDREK